MNRIKLRTSIAIAACALSVPMAYARAASEWRPTITLESTSPTNAKTRVISATAAHGYKLVRANDGELVFSKLYPSDVGYAPGVKPQMIVRYSLTRVGASTRISAAIGTKMVHEGHGESSIIDLTESIGRPELKAILERINANAENAFKRRNG